MKMGPVMKMGPQQHAQMGPRGNQGPSVGPEMQHQDGLEESQKKRLRDQTRISVSMRLNFTERWDF